MRTLRSVRRGASSVSHDRVLIVGGGRAGVATAEELRRQGFHGEVVILCDEPDAPYDRPACSKAMLTGHKRPRDLRMPIQPGVEIRWELGRRAIHHDPVNRTVSTDTDEIYEYDALVVATGSAPFLPPEWPYGEPGLHMMYAIHDSWGVRRDLRYARRVAVIGGGLTGCETAYSVRKLARECVLIDSKPYVLTRTVGETLGRYITEEIAREGVELRLGRRVLAVTPLRQGWSIELDDGSVVHADIVVGTLGVRPNTEWLAGTPGLDLSDGVLCDENLRVVGGENMVAAGDVARWPNLQYDTRPGRITQWIAALEQGRAAAHTLLAGDDPLPPATVIPRFWSDQFGLRIMVCGQIPPEGTAEVMESRMRPGRRDVARAGVMVGYHQDGRLVGLAAANAMRSFTTTARMMLAAPPTLAEPIAPPVSTSRLAAVG